jgi:hypothetical protein
MNQELKAKWLEALRSGKYKQTQGVLNRVKEEHIAGVVKPVGMCCLGVLCDIIDPNGWVPTARERVMAFRRREITGYLPEEIEDIARLGAHDMILAASNDTGQSFEEIADYIEKVL